MARFLVVMALIGGCDIDSAATDAGTDAAADVVAPGLDAGGDAAPRPCALLGSAGCGRGTFCYPFPFNEMPTGETRCGSFQPVAEPAPQCESHVQCPGGSVCATLFAIDTVCHPLCNLDAPHCAAGMECIPLPGYDPAGLCL